MIAERLRRSPIFERFVHNTEISYVFHCGLCPITGTPDMVNEADREGVEIKSVFMRDQNLSDFTQLIDKEWYKIKECVINQPAKPVKENNLFRMHLIQCVACMCCLNPWKSVYPATYYLVYYLHEERSLVVFRIRTYELERCQTTLLAINEIFKSEVNKTEIDKPAFDKNSATLLELCHRLLQDLEISNITDEFQESLQ